MSEVQPAAYAAEVDAARRAAAGAADVIRRHSLGSRDSYEKAEDSPVTQADLEANEVICETLHRAFPEDAVLSEETRDSPERLSAERVWIIDPLDGTKEFIAGIPEYAVSVALTFRGEPVVGVVLQPQTEECFWGAKGGGAWLDDRRVHVSERDALGASVMLSSRTEMARGQIDPYEDLFAEIRPIGSVALKLALTAANRGDLWISMAPKSEWDVCAGDLLVREAGGTMITLDAGVRTYNQEDVLLRPVMAAGPRSLVDHVVRAVNEREPETENSPS